MRDGSVRDSKNAVHITQAPRNGCQRKVGQRLGADRLVGSCNVVVVCVECIERAERTER